MCVCERESEKERNLSLQTETETQGVAAREWGQSTCGAVKLG